MLITEGLAALKTAFELGYTINQRVKEGKLQAPEITDLLLRLQQSILDSQRALNEAAEEVRELKEQLAAKNELEELQKDMLWVNDGGFWLRKSDREAGNHIPYCPLCWGEKRNLVPLNLLLKQGRYRCDIHKSYYETDSYRRLEEGQSSSIPTLNYDPFSGL
jgi:hypothetical protein